MFSINNISSSTTPKLVWKPTQTTKNSYARAHQKMEPQAPVQFSPEERMSASPSPPLTEGTESPRHGNSPSQSTIEAQRRRQQRHSKKLSINFPILLPARGGDTPSSQYTASPTASSSHPMSHGTYFSPPSTFSSNSAVPSSVTVPTPLTPPSEEDPLHVAGKNRGHARQESTSTEFLTLLASQERRVLELKEELVRAETELIALKKQWAMYEAGKKKTEAKGQPVKMRPVGSTHTRAASVVESGTGLGLSGVEDSVSEDKLEAEREKRREIVRERMLGRVTNADIGNLSSSNSKKSGQRVFSSSRHTRALSLLTTATIAKAEQTESAESATSGKNSLDSTGQSSVNAPSTTASPSIPALSRTNSGLEALNFGKTYKDLASAATRKNLPQGLNPEQFVKHGKQMVDGVRDGLWNFFEDIRQATVGDEAISGVRRQNSTKYYSNHQGSTGHPKLRRTMTDAGDRSSTSRKDSLSHKENEASFWKEFGVDTPKSDKCKRNTAGEVDNVKDGNIRSSQPAGRSRKKSTDTSSEPCCSKHKPGKKSQSQNQSQDQITSHPHPKSKSANRPNDHTHIHDHEHHESKSSTSSDHPPSLMSDLLDDEDEGWDAWDSHSASATVSEPGSPRVERKRRTDEKGRRDRAVQWHDLTT